jgi:2-oxoglutarate dehydrogenase E2 component (dihydrolipoamide succinyltransferase)
VPVVRDADQMSFAEIEKTIADFGKRAKDGTLTDRGDAGRHLHHLQRRRVRLAAVDADHQPAAVGILGMHRIEERPVVEDGQIVARPMMYLALSYDHRLVDGREAVTFLVRVKEAIWRTRRGC